MLNLSMQAVRSQAATRTGTMPGTSTGTGPSAGSSAQLATQLQQLTTAIRSLADAMSGAQLTRSAPRTVAGGGGVGGGGGGAASSCGCSSTGSSGAPPAKEAATAPPKKKKGKANSKAQAKSTPKQQGASGAPKDASSAPKKVHGEESHNNLSTRSKRVLDAAHDAGLKLVSGHRPGDSGGHGNGSAIDVGNVKLGTRQGSKEMAAFAEQMRQAGKRGDENIGYVIYNQKIASARNNWAWRPMEDRGSNTQNHFDHVHVSTDPNR